ncbi:Nucleotide-binding universal stress protein, UspA family [Nakamurella panacisegetis]|uniref:Nucleotide-binding universal stress protein, UspA family n=1 Tax=Nakamurella panacisegetis TaxID=1090615 RepID=A0A1H0LUK4_9ACTN|nr:universal stress protein [Nakamurella panacisegetis]SDO71731.1 Nucleotide-binding universal stress protein, UspA family [Nakamurella panacisegetis]
MSIERSNFILVGIDGTPASTAAVLWAADEAARRRADLHLLHAYAIPAPPGFPGAGMTVGDLTNSVREAGRAQLADAEAAALARHPELTVDTMMECGSAVDLLREEAEHALLLVVGTRAEHEFVESVFGSVAARLAGHAPCPVVVIREGADVATTDRPVVIGLDGTPSCEGAVAFAFEEASLRQVELIAVHSWDDSPFDGFQRVYPLLIDRDAIDEEERRVLVEQLGGWVDRYPDVTVRSVVRRGKAEAGLTHPDAEHATVPALVVVGTRGAGRFTALVKGSTSRDLLAHSPIPVAVVRGEYADGRYDATRKKRPLNV